MVVFPKRLRYFFDRDADCLKRVAGIAMREVQPATAGASTSTAAAGRSGGVLFVHRFGATLNAHVHLHLCILDGVVAQGRQGLVLRGARVTAQAGRKLAAGRKLPRSKAADVDSGAPRGRHPARYLWAQLLARIYGVCAQVQRVRRAGAPAAG